MISLIKTTNKKGVSMMVAYVLLIIIALAISVVVFSFLKLYVPKGEIAECEQDIQIVLSEAVCAENKIIAVLSNRGLFTVDGVFIRVRPENFKVRVYEDRETIFRDKQGPPGDLTKYEKGLSPGDSFELTINDNSNRFSGKTLSFEIQPVEFTEKGKAPCGAVITQEISCT